MIHPEVTGPEGKFVEFAKAKRLGTDASVNPTPGGGGQKLVEQTFELRCSGTLTPFQAFGLAVAAITRTGTRYLK